MSEQQKWGYSGDLVSPNEWPKYFHTGRHQSPINILVTNCRHVSQSTCCHQVDKHVQQQKVKHDEARLYNRLKDSLQISSSHYRRAHLDSVGSEDHHRSPSTSSAGSHNSSSSTSSQGNKLRNSSNNSSDYDQNGLDEYERDYYEERKGRHKSSSSNSSSNSNSATSSETTTMRLNDDKRKRQQQTNSCCVTQVQNTRHCVSKKKMFLGYPRYLNTMQLCNTGHNWQVNLPPELANHTCKFFGEIFD